jgi:2-iminobutanoate/2-iminopropanoate deaminase
MAVTVHHTDSSRADELPYTPVVAVDLPGAQLLFLSGMSPLPLYHSHPHVKEETMVPDDIEEQTHRAARKIVELLATCGAKPKDVVKITKYVVDLREVETIHRVLAEYFGSWKPASTVVGIHSLSAPGSRLELDVIAVKTTAAA